MEIKPIELDHVIITCTTEQLQDIVLGLECRKRQLGRQHGRCKKTGAIMTTAYVKNWYNQLEDMIAECCKDGLATRKSRPYKL